MTRLRDTLGGMYERVREIMTKALAVAVRDGGFVIDVREPDEYEPGHVPRAVSIPVAAVRSRARQLPRREPVYVICASGNRSRTVAETLAEQGLEVRAVAGGTQAWIAAGYPVVAGPRARRS